MWKHIILLFITGAVANNELGADGGLQAVVL